MHIEVIYEHKAGRTIKFAPGKSLRFPQLFVGILLSEFRFTVFIPGAVEWIHKSPTAIFSQPTFVTNIWTALFEKEIWKEKLSRLRCSKMPRIWKEKSAEMSCVHFTRLLHLLEHYLKSSKDSEFWSIDVAGCRYSVPIHTLDCPRVFYIKFVTVNCVRASVDTLCVFSMFTHTFPFSVSLVLSLLRSLPLSLSRFWLSIYLIGIRGYNVD